MKDVKKLLQQQSESILPDSSVKDQVKRDLGIYPQREAQAVYAQGGTTSVKTRITWMTAVAIVLIVAIVLTAVLMSLPSGSPITPPYVEDKFQNITSADEFYAYGATSVGALLSGQSTSTAVTAALVNMGKYGGKPTDSQLQSVNGYMLLVEQLMSEEGITEKVVLLQEGDEMYSQYTYRMDVSFTDLSGNKTSYTMYYNTIALTESDRDDDHDDRPNDDDEVEENYAIDGVLMLGSNQYTVEGRYESENQTDETESEMWFRAYLDAENYIEVKQENESETEENETEVEKEYSYTMYNNGRSVYRTVVDYEMEEGETELNLIVEQDNTKDELSIKERMRNGQPYLEVEGKIDGNDVRFDVEVCNGSNGVFYRYHFGDGTSCEMERGRYGK